MDSVSSAPSCEIFVPPSQYLKIDCQFSSMMAELSLSQASSMPESPTTTIDSLSELERGAVRKLDYTILPVMTIFFLLSIMVRVL